MSVGWGIKGPSVFDATEAARAAGKRRLPNPKRDPQIRKFRKGDEARFLKTHLIDHAKTRDRGIFLVRDGRDSVVSYAHFMETRPNLARGRSYEEILLWLIERRGGQFGSWSQSVEAWTGRKAQTATVRFEDLREDPHRVARDAALELGVDLGEPHQGMWSFEKMREADPSVVRAGRVGDWRAEMSDEAVEGFAKHHGEALVKLGYEESADPGDWPQTRPDPAPAAGPAEPG